MKAMLVSLSFLLLVPNFILAQYKSKLYFTNEGLNVYNAKKDGYENNKKIIENRIMNLNEVNVDELYTIPVFIHADSSLWNTELESNINRFLELVNLLLLSKDQKYNVFDEVTKFEQVDCKEVKVQFCLAKDVENYSNGILYRDLQHADKEDQLISNIVEYNALGEGLISVEDLINIYILPLSEGNIGASSDVYSNDDSRYILLNADYFTKEFDVELVTPSITLLLMKYLGIHELWNSNCFDDDVDDTPIHNAQTHEYYSSLHYTTCGNQTYAMTCNIMSGSVDGFMISQGQNIRLRKILDIEGPLSALARSKWKCNTTENRSTKTVKLDCYPNPAIDKIFISYTGDVEASIDVHIYDVSGKAVLNHTLGDFLDPLNRQITISHLSSGIYFIKLKSDKVMVTKKFFKLN